MITVSSLTKQYGNRTAVDDLTFDVAAGRVTGFVGPNGAGKSTTMRMMVGLTRPDSGDTTYRGVRYSDMRHPASVVGTVLDARSMHPGRTARNHLAAAAALASIPARRVDEVLDEVGLTSAADQRTGGFSLGMRQRLALAGALLGQPEVLLLDEPSNGLDPAGMVEMRELIRTLGADGRTTVFLSSHLLGEVEQVCDHVTILARGRCVVSGRVDEVLASRQTGDLRVRVADPEAGRTVLEQAGFTVTSMGDAWRVHGVDDPSALNRMLAERGHFLSELAPIAADLETVFLDLTKDGS